nr:MAG TPA: hypothetical protein [Caudoviricetes sp.]
MRPVRWRRGRKSATHRVSFSPSAHRQPFLETTR